VLPTRPQTIKVGINISMIDFNCAATNTDIASRGDMTVSSSSADMFKTLDTFSMFFFGEFPAETRQQIKNMCIDTRFC
jgi:hypothetical protein